MGSNVPSQIFLKSFHLPLMNTKPQKSRKSVQAMPTNELSINLQQTMNNEPNIETMNSIDGVTCSLYPNFNKLHETHPDLRGQLTLQGTPLEIVLWTRQTKDGTRIYHSATISEPLEKGQSAKPPLVRGLKIYEFRKRLDSDPDFQGTESFELLGTSYYLALWVEVGGKDDFENLKFTLALLKKPYSSEPTVSCQQTLAALANRMRARALEGAQEREYRERQAIIAPSLNEHGEPNDLPF